MVEQAETSKPKERPASAKASAFAEATADRSADKRGLECPRCGCGHFRVLYTRGRPGGKLLRRRECRHCGRRITTYEKTMG